jgi:hypothetical protein
MSTTSVENPLEQLRASLKSATLHVKVSDWGRPAASFNFAQAARAAAGTGTYSILLLQGVAGNKKGDFLVEAQFLSKLHTNNG